MKKIQIIKNGVIKYEFDSITACLNFFEEKSPNNKWDRASIIHHVNNHQEIGNGFYFKIINTKTPEELRELVCQCRAKWCAGKSYETKLKYFLIFVESVESMLDEPVKYRQSIAKIKPITTKGLDMVYMDYRPKIKEFNSKLLAVKRQFKKKTKHREISIAQRDLIKYGTVLAVNKNETIISIPNIKTIQKIKAGIIKPIKKDAKFLKSTGLI